MAHWHKFKGLLIAAIALISVSIQAEEIGSAFVAANQLYEQQRYSEAAAAYDKLVQAGNHSPALYYNLGNAYFKAGLTGRAIAAYREAAKLAPRDPDIQANLQFARDQVQNSKPPVQNLWTAALDHLSVNEWAMLASAFVWIWFLMLAFGQWRPDWRKPLRRYAIGLGLVAVCMIVCSSFAAQRYFVRAAVVAVQEAVVRRGPFDESQSAFTLRDGAELTVLDRKDNWLQVADTANRTGWISENQIAVMR